MPWPDWKDNEKPVEIVVAGETFVGTLWIEDYGFDGEDEFPIWVLRMDGGAERTFADNDSWRFR